MEPSTTAPGSKGRLRILTNSSAQTDIQCDSNPTKKSEGCSKNKRRLSWGKAWIGCMVAYLFVCLVAAYSTWFQSVLGYMNYVNWPIWDLQNLKHYSLAEARNIAAKIPNGDVIRGWHIPPSGPDTFHSLKLEGEQREAYMDALLANSSKIVVYLHGTAANRGYFKRRALARALAAHSGAHVLVFDYRGFGDSTGSPSEEATTEDVFHMMEWIRSRVSPSAISRLNVVIYGQSLGTGIGVAYLTKYRDYEPHSFVRAVILDSPFTSLPAAALSHPIGAAFRIFPPIRDFILQRMSIKYPSLESVPDLLLPVLIVHGDRDTFIPIHHSKRIFEAYSSRHCIGGSTAPSAAQERDLTSAKCARFQELSRYVEVSGAAHDDCYNHREWLLEVSAFLDRVSRANK